MSPTPLHDALPIYSSKNLEIHTLSCSARKTQHTLTQPAHPTGLSLPPCYSLTSQDLTSAAKPCLTPLTPPYCPHTAAKTWKSTHFPARRENRSTHCSSPHILPGSLCHPAVHSPQER